MEQSISYVDEVGATAWYLPSEGKEYLHKEGSPAYIGLANGHEEWWLNGGQHREGDKPAVIRSNDRHQEWWLNGRRHREGNKPAIILANGRQEW